MNLALRMPATKNVGHDPGRDFIAVGEHWAPTAALDVLKSNDALRSNYFSKPALMLSNDSQTVISQQPAFATFQERVFDTLVSLKVSISSFAMHLNRDERRRLFDELDDTVNVEDWHESDKLPTQESFQQFLKWMIYSRNVDWTSIGVSATGTVLVAWRKPTVLLTADFEGVNSVRWTVRLIGEDDEVGHTAGRCSLKLFAEQAKFYLHR
jgi:hypothetical protein